jgi:hypothetical protein
MQLRTTGTARALIPSAASFAFAANIASGRVIDTVTDPSRLRLTANAGEVLAAPSPSATATAARRRRGLRTSRGTNGGRQSGPIVENERTDEACACLG